MGYIYFETPCIFFEINISLTPDIKKSLQIKKGTWKTHVFRDKLSPPRK